MNIFTNLWNNWSTFEKIQELVLLFGIVLLSLIAIYFASKDRRLLMLSALGFVVSSILNVLGIFLATALFQIEISEIFRLIPVLTYILLLSNIGVLVGFFVKKKHGKNFDIKEIQTEYLMDTVKQTVFLLLLGSSIFMFVSIQTQAVLVVSILSCLAGVWSIYWISRYLLK